MNTRTRAFRISHHRSFFTFRSTTHPRSPLRTTLYTTTFLVSAGLFAVYYFDARSALHRFFINPVLRNSLDAETSHKFALNVLKSGLAPRDPLHDDARLKTKVCNCFFVTPLCILAHALQIWELEISNPVGLAAGFDKDGEAIDGTTVLYFSSFLNTKPIAGLFNLGFSWVEIGSVTPKPQVHAHPTSIQSSTHSRMSGR